MDQSPSSDHSEKTVAYVGPKNLRDTTESQPVQRVGDYELIEEIARGGMGVVYRARQVSLNRLVAVKMIQQAGFAAGSERQRFLAEAEAAATLAHPHVVPIYEVGEHAGQPFYSMRVIEGQSLAQAIDGRRWVVDDQPMLRKTVWVIAKVASAVQYAHVHGIIHRDLKPGNILLDAEDVPYVTDFGLAKRLESFDTFTATGAIVGTPAYMAPEQAQGKAVTTAVDIYSLGAILYAALAGEPPHTAESPLELYRLLIESPPPSLRKLNPIVDRELETVCAKCLSKEPDQRYETACALSEDLQRWLDGKPILARPVGIVSKFSRWARRNPLSLAAACLALVLLTMGFLIAADGYRSILRTMHELQAERYSKHIGSALLSFKEDDTPNLVQELNEARPKHEELDHRNWEWNYLAGKAPLEFSMQESALQDLAMTPILSPTANAIAMLHVSSDGFQAVGEISLLHLDPAAASESGWQRALRAQLERREPHQLLSHPALDRSLRLAHKNAAVHVAMEWSPDGQRLAVLTAPGELWIFDTQTRTCAGSITWSAAPVDTCLRWNQTGTHIALCDARGSIEVYSITSEPANFAAPPAPNAPVKPAVRRVSTNREAEFRLDLDPSQEAVRAMTWETDDASLAISTTNRTLFVSPERKSVLRTWPFPVLAWTRSGKQWVSLHGIGSADSASVRTPLALPQACTRNGAVTWSPDERFIAYATQSALSVLEASSGDERGTFSSPLASTAVPAWLPSSDRLMQGSFVYKDIHWSREDVEIALNAPASLIKTAHRGQRVAVVEQGSTEVSLIAAAKSKLHFSGHTSQVRAVDWSADDQRIASLDASGQLYIWSAQDASLIKHLQLISDPLTAHPSIDSDWQVWWSPDEAYLGVSLLGSLIQIFDTRSWTEVERITGQQVRALGWAQNPLALVTEVYSPGQTLRRVRNLPNLATSGAHCIVSWLADSGKTHTHSLAAWASATQLPLLAPHSSTICVPNALGFSLEALDLPDRKSDSELVNYSSLPFRAIQFSGDSQRMFLLNSQGDVLVFDPKNKVTTMKLTKLGPNSQISFAANHLWLADGTRLRHLDATPRDWALASPPSGHSSFLQRVEKIYLYGAIFGFMLIAPGWILLDRSLLIGSAHRILICTALCAVGSLLMSRVSLPEIFSQPFSPSSVGTWVYFLLIALSSILLAGAIAESLRMIARGTGLLCALGWLCVCSFAILTLSGRLWSSNLYFIKSAASSAADALFQAATVWGGMLICGRIFSHALSESRSRSLQFRNAPAWVRWSLLSHTSTSEAIMGSLINVIFGAGLIGLMVALRLSPYAIAITNLSVLVDQRLVVLTACILLAAALLPIALGITALFAVRWVQRRGGWSAQLLRKIP